MVLKHTIEEYLTSAKEHTHINPEPSAEIIDRWLATHQESITELMSELRKLEPNAKMEQLIRAEPSLVEIANLVSGEMLIAMRIMERQISFDLEHGVHVCEQIQKFAICQAKRNPGGGGPELSEDEALDPEVLKRADEFVRMVAKLLNLPESAAEEGIQRGRAERAARRMNRES
jgi:hypothetical protein